MLPKQNTSGWSYNNKEYVPNDSILLTGGFFVRQNRFGHRSNLSTQDVNYSWRAPLKNTWHNENISEDKELDGTTSYAALYSDPKLGNRIRSAAEELGIPRIWLEDSLAMTSGGTFGQQFSRHYRSSLLPDPQREQFERYGETDVGMTPFQQLTKLVLPRLRSVDPDVLRNGAEYVLTSLVNPELADRVAERPELARIANNGLVNLQHYWDALGSHAGRQYAHRNSRTKRLIMSAVHEEPDAGCRWCYAIHNSKSEPFPHEIQPV
jgi:hypothetical protein